MPETTKEGALLQVTWAPAQLQVQGASSTQAPLESRRTFTWPPLTRLIRFNWNDLPSPTGLWDSVYKVCHILWIPPPPEVLAAPTAPPLFLLLWSWRSSQAADALEAKGDHEACNYCL